MRRWMSGHWVGLGVMVLATAWWVSSDPSLLDDVFELLAELLLGFGAIVGVAIALAYVAATIAGLLTGRR